MLLEQLIHYKVVETKSEEVLFASSSDFCLFGRQFFVLVLSNVPYGPQFVNRFDKCCIVSKH